MMRVRGLAVAKVREGEIQRGLAVCAVFFFLLIALCCLLFTAVPVPVPVVCCVLRVLLGMMKVP